ncbi:MAG TPA: sigma-70 family RNA polymerase sigma factor [Ilumatobacter sp.]|nr:sigma-70 family RNA polymerase sigma factor [Ilumatobacter sp.]
MAPDPTPLFEEWRRTGRRAVRNELVEMHIGLAVHIARRFARGARRDDDLEQVALLALVKSVDRFDPARGVPFAAFAGRTIEGELKRYFRDATWAVQVPRSAKELHLAVRGAIDRLTHTLGRPPSVDEVAVDLDVPRDDVLLGLAATDARAVGSLDATPDDGSPAGSRLADQRDPGYGGVDDRDAVAGLLARLPERERTIVELRFYGGLSQSQIAERLGISQMHVSRLLRATLERMRDLAGGDAADALPGAEDA